MVKLCIFDLDGTLVNSLCDLADSVNIVLKKYGYAQHKTDEYRYFVGDGTLKLIERAVGENAEAEQIKLLHEEFSKEYKKRAICKTKPYPGVRELVKELKKRGIKCAVASNKPDVFAKYVVEEIFGRDIFDKISGKREGIPPKPEPDIILNIMDELEISKEHTVLIGDSNVDVKTAKNAKVKSIGCAWGFRGEKELVQAGADKIVKKAEEILNMMNI